MDGASRHTRARLGLQLKAQSGKIIELTIRLDFPASNNETEAIIARINLAISVSSKKIIIRSESQLMVGQVNGEYETRDQRMTKYVSLVNLQLGNFVAWRLEHVSRDLNERADDLAIVAASLPIKEMVLLPVYYQPKSSITTNRVNKINEENPSWMTPIDRYLSSGELSDNRAEAHKIQVQVAWFSLMNGQLYKRSLDRPYLKCLTHHQGQYVLVERHDGVCGNHLGGRMLAHRVHTQGYYWPTMHA